MRSSSNTTRKPRRQDDFNAWAQKWVNGVADRGEYAKQLGAARVEELGVKQHAYAAQTDLATEVSPQMARRPQEEAFYRHENLRIVVLG